MWIALKNLKVIGKVYCVEYSHDTAITPACDSDILRRVSGEKHKHTTLYRLYRGSSRWAVVITSGGDLQVDEPHETSVGAIHLGILHLEFEHLILPDVMRHTSALGWPACCDAHHIACFVSHNTAGAVDWQRLAEQRAVLAPDGSADASCVEMAHCRDQWAAHGRPLVRHSAVDAVFVVGVV